VGIGSWASNEQGRSRSTVEAVSTRERAAEATSRSSAAVVLASPCRCPAVELAFAAWEASSSFPLQTLFATVLPASPGEQPCE
jgi:hypothetical protein